MNTKLRKWGYVTTSTVMLCVAAMSWAGLAGWAHHSLHWASVPALLVPVALDIAAVTCALLALDDASKNETGSYFRMLAFVFVGLSAFVNWRYRIGSGNLTEQVFFPVMSILAYLIVDGVLRKYRRDVQRERSGRDARDTPVPLTRYGLLVWVPFLGHPWRALARARWELGHRIPEPDLWLCAHPSHPIDQPMDTLVKPDEAGENDPVISTEQALALPASDQIPSLSETVALVANNKEAAAKDWYRLTELIGNPASVNLLAERFSLPRMQAGKIRQDVRAESNGHAEPEVS